jgi:hypothetical protein
VKTADVNNCVFGDRIVVIWRRELSTDLGLREIGDDEENNPNEAEEEREEENEPDRATGV